ncbi:unnamed protein product, partial [marine sediment metagenome]
YHCAHHWHLLRDDGYLVCLFCVAAGVENPIQWPWELGMTHYDGNPGVLTP